MSKDRDTGATTVTSADPVAVLSTFRLAALKRTSEIILHPSVDDEQYRASSFSHLAALLASALDFLRVAEESLSGRTAQDQAIAEKSDYDRRLFDVAPVPLLVTTVTGLITEANQAATLLLGEDTFQLDRKSLAEFIAGDERQEFRDRLERMTTMERATHWRFRIKRRRDLPLSVSAVVCAATSAATCSASRAELVTSTTCAIASCSACASRSAATKRAFAVSSATTSTSEGPAGRSMAAPAGSAAMICFAAVTHALPGPKILSTLRTDSVPNASAAVKLEGTFGTVNGDDVLLRQSFSNLIRNSMEACADGGVTPAVRIVGVTPPVVPRIVSGYVPGRVVNNVVTVIVVEPAPSTDAGLNDAVTPDGRPVTSKLTVPVKPDAGVTVAV